VIAKGTPEAIAENPASYTGSYLKKMLTKSQAYLPQDTSQIEKQARKTAIDRLEIATSVKPRRRRHREEDKG